MGEVAALCRAGGGAKPQCGVNLNGIEIKPISDGADLYARLPLTAISLCFMQTRDGRQHDACFGDEYKRIVRK